MPKFEVHVRAHEVKWDRLEATLVVEAEDEGAAEKLVDSMIDDDPDSVEWVEVFDADDNDPELEVDSVEVTSTIEDA